MKSNESADVTLVCDDKTRFKSHKFILSACSPVFESIISDLPESNPIIYLRGVHSQEMKPILQFMYLGQATFYQNRMNEFLNVAKQLEIKEISTGYEASETYQHHENFENFESIQSNNYGSYKKEHIEENAESNIGTHRNEIGQYLCNICKKHFGNTQNLKRHIKSVHEGIKYPCDLCGKTFTQKVWLDRHICKGTK